MFLYKLPCCKTIYIFVFTNAFIVFNFEVREFRTGNDSEFLKKYFWTHSLHCGDTVNVQDVIKLSDNVNIDDNCLTVNFCKLHIRCYWCNGSVQASKDGKEYYSDKIMDRGDCATADKIVCVLLTESFWIKLYWKTVYLYKINPLCSCE